MNPRELTSFFGALSPLAWEGGLFRLLPRTSNDKATTDHARGRLGFDPWVRKIPWRKAWQPIPVFLPGESYGQRNLAAHGVIQSQTRLKRLSTHAHILILEINDSSILN